MVRAALTGNWTDAEAERRAMGENTGSVGGFMVPGALSATVIDLARNQSAFVSAGALTIPMDAPEMTVIKVLTDPTPQWREEHQAVTESDATFGPIRLKSKLLGCICRVSLELMEDAPRFSQTIENAISQSIALELDRVGLFGNGTSEPRGLNSTDGISNVSMGVNGATPDDYDEYLDAILAIENANGVPGAVIMAPRTKRTLSGLKTGISGDKTPLVPPAEFTALKRLVSNQIPITQTQGSATNCSTSFVGDFAQAAVAMRTGLTIEATRVGGTGTFSQFQALIRAYIRADIAVFRPTFFSRIVGIKP
jgi:HK97 family phage major capsid protein